MRDRESREPTTVLDHLRPTVVVRRRVVVDVAALNQPKLESPEHPETSEAPPHRESGCYPRADVASDDDSGPPSSMFAPEGYGVLEEDREEDEDDAEGSFEDERDEAVPPSVRTSSETPSDERLAPNEDDATDTPQPEQTANVDSRPAIPVGPTIAVGTLAKRLGLPSAQVAAELVSRGFFEVTPATILTRDTARIMADAFGRAVEEVPDPEPVKAPRKRTARRAAPAKRTAKGSKPKKRAGAGRTKRAA